MTIIGLEESNDDIRVAENKQPVKPKSLYAKIKFFNPRSQRSEWCPVFLWSYLRIDHTGIDGISAEGDLTFQCSLADIHEVVFFEDAT